MKTIHQIILPMLLGLLAFTARTTLVAQDPFADPPGSTSQPDATTGSDFPFGAETPVDTVQPATTPPARAIDPKAPTDSELHPIVLLLRQNPPKTPTAYANALIYLSRVRQWKEMNTYIEQVKDLNLTDEQYSQMIQEVGLRSWMAMQNAMIHEIDLQQQTFLRSVLDRSYLPGRAGPVLEQNLRALREGDLAQRRLAVRAIQSAGTVGLQALLHDVMTSQQRPTPSMAAAWHAFGESGYKAARAAMQNPNPIARQQVMELLAFETGSDMLPDMAGALYSRDETDRTREIASATILRNHQASPSLKAVLDYLETQLLRRLIERFRQQRVDMPIQVESWRWTPGATSQDPGKVEWHLLDQADAQLEHASHVATWIARLSSSLEADSPRAAATQLEYRYLRNPMLLVAEPMLGDPMGIPAWTAGNPDFQVQVWDRAHEHGLIAAQLRVVQKMEKTPLPLGASGNAVLERLTRACQSGVPAIRWSAAQAILQHARTEGGRTPHLAMRSEWSQAISELNALEADPSILLIGADDSLRSVASTQLSQIGYRARTAGSARASLRWIQQALPVEGIVIVDRTTDMPLGELIQRLRAHPRGSMIPIVVLANELTSGEELLLSEDHRAVRDSLTPDPVDLIEVMKRAERRASLPVIETSDRVVWSEQVADQQGIKPAEPQ